MKSKLFFFPLILILTQITLVACSNPCEKAYDKTVECARKEGIKRSVASRKDVIIKLCSPYKDKVKECVAKDNCVAFSNCMKEATSRLRAVKKKSRHLGEDQGTPAPKKKKSDSLKKKLGKDFTTPMKK